MCFKSVKINVFMLLTHEVSDLGQFLIESFSDKNILNQHSISLIYN